MPLLSALSAGMTNLLSERGRPGRRSSRPRLEILEDRTLLSTDIVTNTNDSGPGSLPATIGSASPGDTIAFASHVTGTITLQSGVLVISKDLDIEGPGAGILTISGNGVCQGFEVNPGVTATISGLTIADGSLKSITGGFGGFGEFLYAGGGIVNDGTLTLTNCTISGNSACYGGGILNYGTLTATGCTISGNSTYARYHTPGTGGGIYNSSGTLAVTDCTISGNSAGNAAGIRNNSNMTVTNSTISGNSGGNGGGIVNDGPLTVTNCTISGNSATGDGGGAYNQKSTLTVTDCTISGNSGGNGGGIANDGTLTVTDSTISGNSSSGGGGGIDTVGTTSNVANTIIAKNTAPSGADVAGGVTSLGYNLIGNSSGAIGFVATDLLNVNPLLGPLQDNGGPTETMGLLPGSPAVAAGNVALIPSGITTDQRGAARIVDGAVDIGAFEVQLYQVFSTADSGRGSLRSALTQANQFGGGVITFTFSGLIGPASPLPAISSDIQIIGPGANDLTISGNDANTVIVVKRGVTAIIAGLTIAGGSSSKGGGIYNEGTLTVTDSTLAANSASGGSGGGIYNDGTLTVTNSTLSSNSAVNGGGICSEGTLTIINSTLAGNSASVVGGGIYNDATLTIADSTLAGNSASGDGGGIYQYEGTLILANTIIATNSAPYGPDILGTVNSKGYNLIGNPSDGSGFVAADLLNLDPLLGPLQDNGGPTHTMALLPGSPAIATGSVARIPAGITTDQRGSARIVNGTVDIGAIESGLKPAVPTAILGEVVTPRKTTKQGKPVGKLVFVGFSIDYSTAMDRSTTDLAANYQVDRAVTRRVKRKRMIVLEPVKFTAAYNQSTNSVTLTVKGQPTFPKGSEIQVTASPPNGVCSTASVLLDAGDTVLKIPMKAQGIRPG